MKKVIPRDALSAASKLALRDEAEEQLGEKVALTQEGLASMPPVLVLKMLHELQVHQIELEMQNETLRQTQLQLVAMQARYFDLYDLAPVSYCTVNELDIILEANLATAELLGETRSCLVGQRISRYINKEFQDTYYLCRKLIKSSGDRQSCELQMVRADGSTFWVNAILSLATCGNGDTVQRLVMTDITSAKVLVSAMQMSEEHLRAIVEAHG